VEESWTGLLAGRSGAAPITKFDPSPFQVRFACEVKGFDPLLYMDKKEARRYDLFAQFALAAAQQAVVQAGLDGRFPSADRTGVIIGSGIGGMQTFEEQCSLYLTKGPDRVSPFFVPMFIPDIAAGLVSIRYGLKGPNFATVSACASSAHAIGESYELIKHGQAEAMVTGGSEAAITGLAIAGFQNMKALSTRNDAPEKAPPVRQGAGRFRAGRRGGDRRAREPRTRPGAGRDHPRRGGRVRTQWRCVSHHLPGAGRRGPARDADCLRTGASMPRRWVTSTPTGRARPRRCRESRA
jgi:3-oxoacyl-[acyl-carrier-protein] synthase II